jgi:hypothetical protein
LLTVRGGTVDPMSVAVVAEADGGSDRAADSPGSAVSTRTGRVIAAQCVIPAS